MTVRRLPPPEPTPEQWAELDRELQPLRDANPGLTRDEVMGSVPAKHIVFEWKRRNRLLPEQQPPE
jgi:hypothetical protein